MHRGSESMPAIARLLWELSAAQGMHSHEQDRHHLGQCLLPPSCCLSVILVHAKSWTWQSAPELLPTQTGLTAAAGHVWSWTGQASSAWNWMSGRGTPQTRLLQACCDF